MTEDPILILWKWDSDSIKDKVVHKLKLPFHSFKSLQISFSGFRNDQLCLVSNKFFCFYACRPFEMKFCFMVDNPEKSDMKNEYEVVKDYGTKILSHYWICDGNFAFSICTDTHIILFDSYFKIIQAINTVKEINESRSHITTILPMIDCFIAAGTNRRFEIYEKKNDLYELAAEKKIFDFSHNILEKLDKNINDKMSENSDKEKIFHFLSLVSNPISSNDNPYVIATTSLNDIIQINTSYKELDKQLIKHIITPFHSDSIEGMDLCINKPYIITCSLDKYLRVWDYRKKALILSKNFDEEMYSVAYHPNGMHALVSFPDKILPLHVYYDEIANMTMNAIPLKSNSRTKDVFNSLI
jgi:WD40 repeat protein